MYIYEIDTPRLALWLEISANFFFFSPHSYNVSAQCPPRSCLPSRSPTTFAAPPRSPNSLFSTATTTSTPHRPFRFQWLAAVPESTMASTTALQPLSRLLQISLWTANWPHAGSQASRTLLQSSRISTRVAPTLGFASLLACQLLLCYLTRGLVIQMRQMEDVFPFIVHPDLCPPARLISLLMFLFRLPRAT